MRIGAHVEDEDPLAEAKAREAEVVQFFLSDPQAWKSPVTRDDADALRESDLDVFIHAPYRINVATTNNRIRIPSRKLMVEHAKTAAELGAGGLIVHGGHVNAGDDIAIGLDNWRKALKFAADSGGLEIPILIENTAGGDNACVRKFDVLARLWDVVGEFNVGFCLDTCHAHAGGEELPGIVERVKAITGRIDLVHLNNSRDGFDSGRDRHANLASGEIDPALLVEVVRTAGAPALVETPGGAAGQGADIAYVREHLT